MELIYQTKNLNSKLRENKIGEKPVEVELLKVGIQDFEN